MGSGQGILSWMGPAIVPGIERIGRLTYSETSELTYFDHYSFSSANC